MSNVSQKEKHLQVFISYSHEDNRPPKGSDQGWVTHFYQMLEEFMREMNGKPSIWWDNTVVRCNDIVDETVLEPLSRVAILITVVSPNYADSNWCAREFAEFCRAVKRKPPGLYVLNKSRIFMVSKMPLREDQELHDEFKKVPGFKFFDDRDTSKKPVLFRPHDEKTKERFDDIVGDLAWDVRVTLELLNRAGAGTRAEAALSREKAPREKSVFLAETTPDLTPQRANVRRDLLHRGYNVVELSTEVGEAGEDELRKQTADGLRECAFSIHLVGEEFGECASDSETSVVELQDRLAAEHAKGARDFQQLIWVPDDVKLQHHTQRRFVNNLLKLDFEHNTELLRGYLEDFKSFVQDKIKLRLEEAARGRRAPAGGPRPVAVVCESLDERRAHRLAECLDGQGCSVSVVAAGGEASALSEANVAALLECDGVVVYADNAPLFWVRSRLQDLAELENQRQREFVSVAVYVEGQKTAEKVNYYTRKAVVIKNFEDAPEELLGPIPPNLLRPFLEKLDEEERGQAS